MALDDYALTDVSTAQSELGVSGSTSALERYIHRFSDLFREATGRPWHRLAEYTEKVESRGGHRLIVERTPIHSIVEIKIDGDTIDADDYEIEEPDKGYIRKVSSSTSWEHTLTGRRRVEGYATGSEETVEVTYDGGYATPVQVSNGTHTSPELPKSIEGAVLDSVVNAFRAQGAPTNRDSESIDGASVSFVTGGASNTATVQGQKVSDSFAGAVQRHKDRNVLK